ncbi:protein kinase domain-containing protein [Blastopirellula marina]|uniref:Protein kinase domain-containing protein n=1 Tax=Blastopirellula marina TaxID=124 RepID=A0A2S8GDU1_9BACT|nr:protein kinase [Blastopirellula marina]PQO42593.1 hypothetical protein C5Y98_01785 [Blastopirellula marina]PTL46359.1 hypothetical protein C5Y97_01785 [Blastopirellula marina]
MPLPHTFHSDNSQALLRRYVAADPEAAQAIVDRYVNRLLPLIRKQLSASLRPRIDAEDVAQSAFRSFFLKARDDRFTLASPGDLWRLLATLSLNKLRRQVERHTAGKRAVAREVVSDRPLPQHDALPHEAQSLLEEVQFALNEMPVAAHDVLKQFLAGQSLEQLAATSHKSPRTLRRWVQALRDHLEQRLRPERIDFDRQNMTLSWKDYVLKQHVGSGGFGKVYRAIETRRNRTVAIKSLHKRHQKNLAAVRQFVRESQLMAKVCHPGIVGVHGLGQYPGGGYFLVMDWVDGENLQQRITRQPLPLTEAIQIARSVAQAIAAAHANQVIHGDLKPSNLLVSRQNAVYVADFGLASLRSQVADANMIRGGTLAYLAPEQLTRSPVDFPVDVYGLGALLYAMLTGRPPRSGRESAILDELEQGIAPRPPSSLGLSLPASLEAFVMKCLAADPNQRCISAEQFGQRLAAIGRTVA